LRMKPVSNRVRYLPILVLAAFSQWVSFSAEVRLLNVRSNLLWLPRLHIDVDGHERKLFAAFGAFPLVLVKYLIRRSQFWTLIQDMPAPMTYNTLRHAIPSII